MGILKKLLMCFCTFLLLSCSEPNSDGTGGEEMPVSKEEKIAHISNLGYSENLENAEEITRYLDDEDSDVVGQALFFLGYLGARDYIPNLAEKLESNDKEIVNMAASGLSLMVDSRDKYLLEKLYGILKNEFLLARMSAIEAIGNIQSNDSTAILMAYLEDEKPAAQLEIIRSLGKIGDPVSLPILESYLENVKTMDHSVPNTGGTRGSEPHPSVLQMVLEESIKNIKID